MTPVERYVADVMRRREGGPRPNTARHPFGDLGRFQGEQAAWSRENFGRQEPLEPMLGMGEEAGELAEVLLHLATSTELLARVGKLNHLTLKMHQGIRGSREELEVLAKDAIGDLLVFLSSYCTLNGWSLADILLQTWAEVRMRDWKNDAVSGTASDEVDIEREAYHEVQEDHYRYGTGD